MKPKYQSLGFRILLIEWSLTSCLVFCSLLLLFFSIWIAIGLAVRETSASEAILTAITYVLVALIVSCPCAIKLIKHSRSAREMILHEIDMEENGQGPPENNGASDPVSSGIRRRPRGGGTEESQPSITRPKKGTTKSVMVDFRIHGSGISVRKSTQRSRLPPFRSMNNTTLISHPSHRQTQKYDLPPRCAI